MNAPAEPMTLIPTRANVNQATNITVDSLGFKYGDDLPWLYQNLSFNIQAEPVDTVSPVNSFL